MALDLYRRYGQVLRGLVVLALGGVLTFPAAAQEIVMPAGASPEQMKAIAEAQARQKGAKPNGDAAKPDEKKEGEEKKEEGDDKDKKKDEDNSSIKRPEKPPRVPDPREFDVKLDKSGRVPPFNFIGQTWPDVLQWLANISDCSLDWQELPNDYLNLTTQQSYSLDEVRDLVNRHLHARGYTILVGDGILSVFKIEKLDPSLVPRVTEDDLYDRKPNDFVKVSFELPQGMEVDKAKEDVKQLLGPHAKIFPLAASKRLLVIDAVANLRTVSELMNQERLVQEGRIVPREFPLKHARAEQIIDVLYVVVGLDPQSRPSQMELQLQQQKLQLMMQMQQQGKDVSKMLKPDGPPVYLAYNRQRNSVLVNAPPDYMKIVERTIRYLDVPAKGVLAEGGTDQIADAGDERQFKKYRLETLDPDRLVMTLQEIGGLDPWTELRADASSKSLWVQASAADHAKIERLVKQFDGEGREFYVLRLRRVAADLAAVSIKELMFGEEKKDDNNSARYIYYFGGRDQDNEKPNPHEGFRVVSDIDNNRLLLRATQEEMADVRRLLAQMGESPPEQSNPEPVRFVQPGSDAARARLLEQLKSVWPSVGGNELIIRVPESEAKLEEEQPKKVEPAAPLDAEPSAALPNPVRVRTSFAQFALAAEPSSESVQPTQPAAPEKPPVTISVTADGRLMINSADTAALDRLEQLIEQMAPPEKRFKVFHLDYVTAYSMYLTLYDYFEPEIKGEQEVLRDYWGDPIATVDKAMGSGLGSRKRLMITWDTASNTILVANASPRQLWEVQELIKEYDIPAPADSIKSRRTAAIKIHYSKASTIAAALKDVYRDLLSSRDREFQSGDKKEEAANQERTTIIRYGGFSGGDDDNKRPAPVKLGFEGALSVGVDDISNMIIVSVQEELFDNVVTMVRQLDEEARPRTTVRVHRVSGQVDAKSLRKAIQDAMGTPWPGGRPEKAEAAAGGDAKPKGEEGMQNSAGRRQKQE